MRISLDIGVTLLSLPVTYSHVKMDHIYQNIQRAQALVARYVELDEYTKQERFRIRLFSRKRQFVWWGVGVGWVLYLLWYHSGGKEQDTVIPGVLAFGGSILVMRYVVGPMLDRRKKRAMEQQAVDKCEPMLAEMNRIADELEADAVLPAKYRTLHACGKLLEYIRNGRIGTLREGINLYEEEVSRELQHEQLRHLARQNEQLINQQQTLIDTSRELVRAQRVTNTLLFFQ